MKKYMVEISLKSYVLPPDGMSRFVCYRDVWAEDEYCARHKAITEFEKELKYRPSLLKKAGFDGYKNADFCASDSVEI